MLDLDVAKRNIATMAEKFAGMPARLRPHIKVHKSAELARMQVEAGAVGVAVRHRLGGGRDGRGGDRGRADREPGRPARQGRGRGGAARATTGSRSRWTTRATSTSSRGRPSEAGSRLELLIEVDVGMGRCGVRTKERGAARSPSGSPSSRARALRGMQAYEGHCMLEPDPDVRAARGARGERRSSSTPSTSSPSTAIPCDGRLRAAAPAPTSSPARTRGSPRCRRARTR